MNYGLTFIYDTETSNFHNARLAPDHPEQGRCVWFAGVIMDGPKEIHSVSIIQRPEGKWCVSEGAAKIHGITTEKAERYGMSQTYLMATYYHMQSICEESMSYNLEFDDGIMRTEAAIIGRATTLKQPHKRACIMLMASDIMKMPPTPKMIAKGMGKKFKNPNLMEAHQHFLGEGFDGAHGALADCRAAARVLWKIRSQGELA